MNFSLRRFLPHTLAAQLIAVIALAVLLSNIGVAVYFQMGNERTTESAFYERMADRAVSAAELLSAVPAKARPAAIRAMESGVWRFELLHGKTPEPPPMSREEASLASRVRALLPPQRAGQPVSVKFHDVPRMPVRPGARPSGPIVEITVPVVRGTQLRTFFFRPPPHPWPIEIFFAAFAAIVVTSAAAAFIASRVARPLSKLASSASEAARGGAAVHVPEEGPEDVRNAAKAFNAMTDQVARTLASQRQLLSAVGHDLRTPITAMRISTEFIEDGELRERLQKNLLELQELTEAVLSFAKGAGLEQKRNVDLAALLESVCTDLDDLGESVEWQAHDPAPFFCRPNEVKRAIRNLAENAVAYGGRAHVRLEQSPAAYEVIVEDDGPGIPEADQARVFEPFVRLESSRNLETGGTGLGLTLVKAIAEGHGGSVVLENRSEGGLRVRLRLPRSAEAA
ncbi:MAG TPA: ATP-binding protein [Rhizomicrobium sp.]|jgi:signal transduction histidine kinase